MKSQKTHYHEYWHDSDRGTVDHLFCHGAASKELAAKDPHLAGMLNMASQVQPALYGCFSGLCSVQAMAVM